jgi:hypothetical protein
MLSYSAKLKVRPKSASVEETIFCYNRYMPRHFFKAWMDPRHNSPHYINGETRYEANFEAIIDRILLKLRFAIWNFFRK